MAKPKTKKTKLTAEEIGTKLAEIRGRMAKDKVLNDALTRDFKEALAVEGLREAGGYHVSKSSSFKVIAEELAMPFALQRGLVKIDTSQVREVFRLDQALRFENPERFGFESTTIERVVPRCHDEGEE